MPNPGGNQEPTFYNFGLYLATAERIRKIMLVITRTNGIDVDANASLAIQGSTAEAITNILPYQEWKALRIGTHKRSFTTYLQQQINNLTATTYWRAANATNYGLSLEYTGDGANWGNTASGTTATGSSGTLGDKAPSQKQIVLLFTSTKDTSVSGEIAYKVYTEGGTQYVTTADGSNTDKSSVFTLDSLSSMSIGLTSQGTALRQEIKEFAVKNMPGASAANLSGYIFNINTNLYQSGTNDVIEKTVASQFSTGQNFADEDGYDYSEQGGFDSSGADDLDTNTELATQLRSMLAGNSALSSLTFGAITDSGIVDEVNNGTPNISYFTITGAADGRPFDLTSNTSAARKVRKFTNNNIDNAGSFQVIFKDLDFGQPGLMKNIYKVYVRWRVKDHEDDMSKTYVKAFYGIDGENLEQTGYGRTFDKTKGINYNGDGLVWHEDTTDIKTTTISDALRNDPVAGFTVACTADADETSVYSTADYAVGLTTAMTFDNGGGGDPSASTSFPVGYELVNDDGVKIGTVSTATSTQLTCSDGIEVAVSNNDRMVRSMTLTCSESDSIAVPQSVSGAGIQDDTYITSVNDEGAVDFFNISKAVTADLSSVSVTFKSNRVTVASVNDIKRGDAGMIKTTTSSERMLLTPFNDQDKIIKLFRPYQSGVAGHASGSIMYIFPKTKSYVSELIPTDNIRNINSFQLKLETGTGAPAHFEIEDISIVYRIKGVR